MKETIRHFLLCRLQESGFQHIFGVPGDYMYLAEDDIKRQMGELPRLRTPGRDVGK